jgi:hypothetical protein
LRMRMKKIKKRNKYMRITNLRKYKRKMKIS